MKPFEMTMMMWCRMWCKCKNVSYHHQHWNILMMIMAVFLSSSYPILFKYFFQVFQRYIYVAILDLFSLENFIIVDFFYKCNMVDMVVKIQFSSSSLFNEYIWPLKNVTNEWMDWNFGKTFSLLFWKIVLYCTIGNY